MTHAEKLQQSFVTGTPPKDLDGFYPGKLDLLLPGNFTETIGGFVFKFWLPWYGKDFNKMKQQGMNVVPSYLFSFLHSRLGDKAIVKKTEKRLAVFPFTTKRTKGLADPIEVLQLNYNLPENPRQVQQVIDELVCVGKQSYLGKAYMKEKEHFRLVAFFSLARQE